MSIVIGVDLGGTKTILQAVESDAKAGQALGLANYPSADFESFEQMLQAFLRQYSLENVDAICIGVAGPVKQGNASVTNLPWRLSARDIAQRFSINTVELLNDFQVIGYALEDLPATDIQCLQSGHPDGQGMRALIGAGTGLGHAILTRFHGVDQVLASEAGHIDFAPRDSQQDELLQFMRARYQTVSYERLVSGPGLEHIYWFLSGGSGDAAPLDAASISHAALNSGADKSGNIAWSALQLFLTIYGAAAGNFALACLPRDGLYVAGGIAARILPLFKESGFMTAFHAKSKMRELMQGFPVYVVANPQVGLMGALARAKQLRALRQP